jgi:hypothetical protein
MESGRMSGNRGHPRGWTSPTSNLTQLKDELVKVVRRISGKFSGEGSWIPSSSPGEILDLHHLKLTWARRPRGRKNIFCAQGGSTPVAPRPSPGVTQ